MTTEDFTTLIMECPWVEGGACFSGADCWGVVVLYYRHVHGIEIENDNHGEYINSISDALDDQLSTGDWEEIDGPDDDGVVFMAYQGDTPTHCGVISNGRVLHSSGSRQRDLAYCRRDRFEALQRMYRDMRFFIHRDLLNRS